MYYSQVHDENFFHTLPVPPVAPKTSTLSSTEVILLKYKDDKKIFLILYNLSIL